jgi:mono/diheme cytochrome c family protein
VKTKMNKLLRSAFLGLTLVAATQVALAQDSEAVARGKAKFDHSCAPCHGKGAGDDGREMLPGTYSLKIKYGDTLPAALEDRTDLSSEVISVFVRMGAWSMPPFRKTELSDKEIDDIAAYFAVSSRAGN